jgi:PAS domain S-box-containing protein
VVEFAPDAIVIVDPDGRIHLANAQVTALFGYAADELVGETVDSLLPDRFRGAHAHHREQYLQRPLTRPMGAGLELFGRRRDGSEFPVDISLAPLETDQGRLVVAAVRDVTDRKRLEALRDEFIANAAHELRTPIATITGITETLGQYLPQMTSTQVDQMLAALARQSERANALVKNLLDLSRLEIGRGEIEMAEVDVAAVAGWALETAPPPDGRNLHLDVDHDLYALADDLRLAQVLVNLLTNAYRYGGPNITLSSEGAGSRVVVAVADDGPGVPDTLVGSMFEPFTRGPNAAEAGGSGIGLALCRRIVEAFGGSIAYRSDRGGACFEISLRSAR